MDPELQDLQDQAAVLLEAKKSPPSSATRRDREDAREQKILERSQKNLLKAIDKELDVVRDAAKKDAGRIFNYQTLLFNFRHQVEKS